MRSKPLFRWLSVSLADTAGRTLLQIISTAVLARILVPAEFGLAALASAGIAIAAAVITAPIEEALAQRKVLRSGHFRSALGFAVAMALLALISIWLAGQWQHIATTAIYPLLFGFSTVLLAEGPIAIYSALARRQRNFSALAWSNLIGLAVGTGIGIMLAFLEFGVWSLIALRVISRFATLAILLQQSRVKPRLDFSVVHLRDLSGFAGWLVACRLVETLCEAVFQSLVNYFFGLTANGYLNMAQRIVEPLRGSASSISHNLASAYYFRLQNSASDLGNAIAATVAETAWLLQPIFFGLAAISPTLVVLLGGPEWKPAASLAICLALAAAISTATSFVHSGISASNRNDLGLISSCIELLALTGSLIMFSKQGLIALGVAKLVAVLADAVFVLFASQALFSSRPSVLLRQLIPSVSITLPMGLLVAGFGLYASGRYSDGVVLTLQILMGMIVQGVLMMTFYKHRITELLDTLFGEQISDQPREKRYG
jgi:O-antigen/teichoic acid export membrane protein